MVSNRLSVYMNGFLTGTLLQEKNGAHTFNYEPSWLATVDARPISLSLPLRQTEYKARNESSLDKERQKISLADDFSRAFFSNRQEMRI